jgi:hypothetical protein
MLAITVNDWPVRLAPDPTYARRERARRDPAFKAAALKLAAASPGGRADNPIVVRSASEIEGAAESMPCPVCTGTRRIDDHVVRFIGGQPVRLVVAHCRHCGVDASLFFRIRRVVPD